MTTGIITGALLAFAAMYIVVAIASVISELRRNVSKTAARDRFNRDCDLTESK